MALGTGVGGLPLGLVGVAVAVAPVLGVARRLEAKARPQGGARPAVAKGRVVFTLGHSAASTAKGRDARP